MAEKELKKDPRKRIIEIEGVKLEVDLRDAKQVDHYRVGDRVKILIRESEKVHKVYSGVIVGYENFKSLPTIVVCYMKNDWQGARLEFGFINADNTSVELVPAADDLMGFGKEEVLRRMDKAIADKEAEIKDLQGKRGYFLKHFDLYFKLDLTKAEKGEDLPI